MITTPPSSPIPPAVARVPAPISQNGSLTTTITLRWSQRADVTYVVQESDDLVNWGPATGTPVVSSDQSGACSIEYVVMEVAIPIATGKKFVHVRATVVPPAP